MSLRRFFNLSIELAKASFKQRNEGSYLGILWYLLNPILTFAILYLVFSRNLGLDIPHYYLYLLIGILMFNLFQRITSESVRIIEFHRGIIKSVRFTHEALPFSVVLHALFSHFFETILLFGVVILSGTSFTGLVFYPFILASFCLFNYGLALFLSSLTVYIVDLDGVWAFFVRIIWLGTPIFYSLSPDNIFFFINYFNPLYFFITAARDIFIFSTFPDLFIIMGLLTYSLLSFIIGSVTFNFLKNRFAEMI